MKFLLTILLGTFAVVSFAQGTYTQAQRRKDSLLLDSLGNFWDLRGPNRVFANLQPKPLLPVSDICFNKKITYYTNVNGNTRTGCFYINTKDGYVAMFYNNYEESCKGINSFEPGYDMVIVASSGSSIHYRMDKRGKKTYFTEPPLITDIDRSNPTEFIYKNPNYTGFYREPFTDQHLPTVPYVINGSPASSTRYLFGPSFPRTIKLKNYLGAFGLGYFDETGGSTYICLAMEAPNLYVRVDKIEDVAECFDGSQFNKNERQEREQEFEKKLAKDRQRIEASEKTLENAGSTCATDVQKEILKHKKLILEKEAKLEAYMKTGKSITDPRNIEGQKILASAGDAKDKVILKRLEYEQQVCNVDYSIKISKKNYPRNSIAKLEARKECLFNTVEKLKKLEMEMTEIDRSKGYNYAKAIQEKNMLYFRGLQGITCK
jgi:hypothetical protein